MGKRVLCFEVYLILFLLKGLHISPSITEFRKLLAPDQDVTIFRHLRYLLIPCHI